jgi:hypothetical protein
MTEQLFLNDLTEKKQTTFSMLGIIFSCLQRGQLRSSVRVSYSELHGRLQNGLRCWLPG